ncbi:GH92 family glycosyl hydrolase [Chondrinema litorale]|uniref:GH92 family glycosyl hydrolase n=1 Tax=Chondrinema litorale TaxID=2994555 RepID=UPI0025434E80|nr:GH92 family glycosyl hydrolase [Chondrinema litorale]UZR97501.1 GH92 family glycosyl hydrolase [Chondrinema litorale]
MKIKFLTLHLFLICTFILSCSKQQEIKEEKKVENYTDLVYPWLDSSNSRWFFFNTATRPFGMVNLSPDTDLKGAWGSGYHYSSDTIRGFSHVHAWQLAGVSVMPVMDKDLSNTKDYYSPYSHDNEIVKPGYHKINLQRDDIDVELTSTLRVGFHKYIFKKEGKKQLVLNMGGQLGPSKISYGEVKSVDKNTISGQVVNAPTIRRPYATPIFFAIQFDKDITGLDSWVEDKSFENTKEVKGAESGILVSLADGESEVLMKVGISYVSSEQALLNINEELNHWDFEKVVSASFDEWNEHLGRIAVEGGTDEERRRFYTDLWHALQGRRTISDANGKYADFTSGELKVKQIPLDENGKPKFRHFNSDSFWGAQWTINTLWHLVYPEVTEEFVNSLLQYYKDGGLIPRGPSGGNYTYVMTGASATPFIVSAYQKGIKGFDINLAYEGLKKDHMSGGIMAKAGYEHKTSKGGGLDYYIDKGYVPWPIPEGEFGFHQDGPSLTMEYAYQDWTLAQLAKALNKEKDYKYFLKRSENYKNIYDATTGWARPKDVSGKWKTPYDPYEYAVAFNESNGAQATWFVPQDLDGLAKLMGGKEAAIKKLNEQFEEASKLGFTSGTSHAQETHEEYKRIPINYGNQPSIQTAFVFHKLGRPDLTQYWSRQVVNKVYTGLSPDFGYNGDEDQGLMGSLSVLLKTGIFQMTGGTEANPVYEIGSPIFEEINIKLNPDYYSGGTFTIKTINNSADNVYVKKASFKEQELTELLLKHSDITNGGELILEMGAKEEN